MKVLLDTQAWLWFVLGDPALSSTARAIIEDPANEKFVSPASYWEIAIKINVGKYVLPQPYEQFVQNAIGGQSFLILPILPEHTALVSTMPMHHRDPFDRLIVAQALAEDIPLVSCDGALGAYGIHRVW